MKNRKYVKMVNILTLEPHARKSWVLDKKAANKKIDVGIISTPLSIKILPIGTFQWRVYISY
jgi:hypothetical protein